MPDADAAAAAAAEEEGDGGDDDQGKKDSLPSPPPSWLSPALADALWHEIAVAHHLVDVGSA